MFYSQQLIHTADSPRNQAPIPWAFNKTLRTGHKHIEAVNPKIQIDHRNIEEQIAQGFVYLKVSRNNKKIQFLYKIPAGIYTQHGFSSGAIDVPLPELYIAGSLYLYEERVSSTNIRLGSPYLPLLPLSNIYNRDDYEPFEIERTQGKPIFYMKMCTGSVLVNLLRGVKTPLEAINKLQGVILPFFLSYGNYDLSLCNWKRDALNEMNARAIAYKLECLFKIPSDQYTRYWVFLNHLIQKYDVNYIYETLASMTDPSQIFEKFDITLDEIQKAYQTYQSSESKIRN